MFLDKDNLYVEPYGKITFSKAKGTREISCYQAKGKFGTIDIKEISYNEFDVCEFSFDISEALKITSQSKGGLILTIPTKSDLSYCVEGLNKAELLLQHYNLIFSPRSTSGVYAFTKGRYLIFSIYFNHNYLMKWNETMSSNFLKNVHKEKFSALRYHLAVTGEMMFIVNELFLERPLPEMYRYAKVTELLRLSVVQRAQSIKLNRAKLIEQRDKLKLEQAKKHLENHISDDPGTIEEISKIIGLSSPKLKREFKKLYGKGIFEFTISLRMEKAKSLLLDSDLAVQQIASVVSYKHPPAFTTAFKRYFGYSPSSVREKYARQ